MLFLAYAMCDWQICICMQPRSPPLHVMPPEVTASMLGLCGSDKCRIFAHMRSCTWQVVNAVVRKWCEIH